MKIDNVIHQPARLRIMMILSAVDRADFKFLVSTLGVTKGNLNSHMDRLERAGFVEILKSFRGKLPYTEYRLTKNGHRALKDYWDVLDHLRNTNGAGDRRAEADEGISE